MQNKENDSRRNRKIQIQDEKRGKLGVLSDPIKFLSTWMSQIWSVS